MQSANLALFGLMVILLSLLVELVAFNMLRLPMSAAILHFATRGAVLLVIIAAGIHGLRLLGGAGLL